MLYADNLYVLGAEKRQNGRRIVQHGPNGYFDYAVIPAVKNQSSIVSWPKMFDEGNLVDRHPRYKRTTRSIVENLQPDLLVRQLEDVCARISGTTEKAVALILAVS